MRLRLQIDHAKGLVYARPDEQAGAFVDVLQGVTVKLAQELHPRAEICHQCFDLRTGRAVTDDL